MTFPDAGFMIGNGGSCLPCTPEEECRIVAELNNTAELNLKEGDTFYVISTRWFTSWQRYVGQHTGGYTPFEHSWNGQPTDAILTKTPNRPGPIDNSDIVLSSESSNEGNGAELLRTLLEGRDYVFVPQEVWEKLFDWYKGGPELPRKLISQGVRDRKFVVEVYPLCLHLVDSRDDSEMILRLSRKASTCELHQKVCALKGVEEDKVRIWDYFNRRKDSLLVASEHTLEDYNLQMDQDILLEVHANGFWSSGPLIEKTGRTGNELALVPIDPSRSSISIAGGPSLSNGCSTGFGSNSSQSSTLNPTYTDIEDGHGILNAASKGEGGGLAGLQNLGNTCFMNSAIQCLVHTPPLAEYFLKDYTDDINTDNPLGMRGELALAFGELLRKLWSSRRQAVAPRAFKGKLSRFAPQFCGYNQHDSQELLAFLLDGLHEDLNRVRRKPYIEAKSFDGCPDEEVADECWSNHKARNDSFIVDVCQGQYKSTLVCPVCGEISVTFDPFMYLSLPLPSKVTRTMTITVLYGDGRGLPMPYTVTVLKHGCCKDLSQALGSECCLRSDESLLLAEVYENRIYRYFESPLEPLSSIKDDEHIVAYRLPKNFPGLTRLEISHLCQEKCSSDGMKISDRKFMGSPLVTYIGENPQTGLDIDIAVSRVLFPLKKKMSFSNALNGKENGSFLEAAGKSGNNYDVQLEPQHEPMEVAELEETSCSQISFQLYLTDDRGLNCKPIEKDSLIKPGISLKVMMNWTKKEHEIYDASYLKDLPEVFKNGFIVKKTRQEAISLFSCLEAFLKEEPLGPDDMWYCPKCKEHRQATKKLDLWRLPNILVFHLKRFSYSRYMKNKLDIFVNFPIHNLDLSRYVKSDNTFGKSHVYELYAISNHYGGLGGGHYSAYAKLIDDNKWYHFDDSHVSPASESEIRTSAAYVLFYQRVEDES